VSGWQISGIILASALAVLLLALAYLMAAKLGAVIAETQNSVRRITDELIPTLQGVTVSVDHVNDQLVRVDAITGNVEKVTTNVSGLTSVFAATLGGPAIKAAAFSYGVRRALGARKAEAEEKRVKAQLKAEAKAARAAKRKG
jgi:predicted PurR-regulated permease PerM